MDLGKEELTRRIRVHSEIIQPIVELPRANQKGSPVPLWRAIELKKEELRLNREFTL
jgi:hypothetical protein